MSDAKLNEFDKAEWEAVYRALKPNATRAEFDADWDSFVAAKAEHERQKDLQ